MSANAIQGVFEASLPDSLNGLALKVCTTYLPGSLNAHEDVFID